MKNEKEINLENVTEHMDMVLCNTLGSELVVDDYTEFIHTEKLDKYESIYDYLSENEIFQYFVISEHDMNELLRYENVVCLYNSVYDVYMFCNNIVFGMSWEFVPMKLTEKEKIYETL